MNSYININIYKFNCIKLKFILDFRGSELSEVIEEEEEELFDSRSSES